MMAATRITEETWMPIGLVGSLLGLAIAGAWYVAHIDSKVEDHTRDIARIEARQIAYVETVQAMKTELHDITYQLKRMNFTMRRNHAKDVASRAGAPKLQCSLYQPGPFSMTD